MNDSIVNLILNTLADKLRVNLQDAGVTNAEVATVVRPGLAQQNPVTDRISVFLHHGDPDDVSINPEWKDKVVAPYGGGSTDGGFAAYTIGGGVRYWRAFTIEVKAYFVRTQEVRDDARQTALNVFSRIVNVCVANQAFPLQDNFGEYSIVLVVEDISDSESGGPPAAFNWRGKVRFRVLTEKTVVQ